MKKLIKNLNQILLKKDQETILLKILIMKINMTFCYLNNNNNNNKIFLIIFLTLKKKLSR